MLREDQQDASSRPLSLWHHSRSQRAPLTVTPAQPVDMRLLHVRHVQACSASVVLAQKTLSIDAAYTERTSKARAFHLAYGDGLAFARSAMAEPMRGGSSSSRPSWRPDDVTSGG